MATIILGAIGGAIGSSIGGSILGIGAAAIGKAIGAGVGRLIDQSVIAILTPDQQNYGPEVGRVGFALPREGEMLPRGRGWQKLPARICWPENLHFSEESETVSSGGKGAQNKTSTTSDYAEVTIAVAIHDGEIDFMGRVWADGSLITLADVCNTVTFYKGTATQGPDPTLEAVDGIGNVPDWRGVAYVVLEGFNLSTFGNRIPQLEFEVFKAAGGGSVFTGISLAPTAGEFGLDPALITERVVETVQEASGPEEVVIEESPINNNAVADAADIKTALDLMKLQHPQVNHVVIEYPWFGDDLRAGSCQIKPRVEMASRETAGDIWAVQGIARGSATIISQIGGAGAYAGTPSDAGVIRLIENLKNRGYQVTLVPQILMDIPAGNGMADPYGEAEQAAYADRGLITCDPAAGQTATVDKTAAAALQVDAFFGTAVAINFATSGATVSYNGLANDWGLRRFVLHAAHLAIAAGGVNDFVIASGLSGLTRVRSDATTYPAVAHLQALAAELRGAFDAQRSEFWSPVTWPSVTYTVPDPGDGVVLSLGYRWGLPMPAGWKWDPDGTSTSRAWHSLTKSGYTYSGGVDGYLINRPTGPANGYWVADFEHPFSGKIDLQIDFEHGRFPGLSTINRHWNISEVDSVVGFVGSHFEEPTDYPSYTASPGWVADSSGPIIADVTGSFLRFSYWVVEYDRVLRDLSLTVSPAKLVRLSYLADWREYGAHDVRDGSGDVLFPLDDLWASAAIDTVSIIYMPPLADQRDGDAGSVYDLALLKAGIEAGEFYDWEYQTDSDRQSKTRTLIADAASGEPWVFRAKDIANWAQNAHHPRPSGVRSATPTAWVAGSKKIRLFYSCPAVDRAANQPSVEVNQNASGYALPHFSNGARDDEGQATYLRAIAEFWAADARGVVDASSSVAAGWDARPWPIFPHTDIWPDAAGWPTGRSMAGRRSVELAEWLKAEMEYRGLAYDFDQITGAIDGITVNNLAGFMAVAGPLLKAFHLDATELAGKIKITSRALQEPLATVDLGAVIPLSEQDRFRAPRGNPGTLPAMAWLTHKDIGHEYDVNTVPSRLNRQGKSEMRVDFPALIDPQSAADLLRRLHVDAQIEMDSLECELPPSWLPVLVPGRTVLADTGLGLQEWLIMKRTVGSGIRIEARRLDRAALRPNPTSRIGAAAPSVNSFAASAMAMPDLPWIKSSEPAHDLRAAIFVNPPQGTALQRSLSEATGYTTVGQFATRATMGVLTSDLPAGNKYLWDRGTALSVRLYSGGVVSKSAAEVRGGQNWIAVRTDAVNNDWEIIGFRDAAITGTGAYDLSTLMRGLRGSQIAANVPAGALVVLLDGLPFAGLELDDVGTAFYWAGGPSAKARTDASWTTRQVTPRGAGLKPFAPTRLRGEIDGVGDLGLTWLRQDRDPRATIFGRSTTPMSEESLLFRITIGAATWQVAAEASTIPAADLPPLPFDVIIQQISSDVGLGHAAQITME